MIKVGTSGFSFPDWVGNIYPANIKKGDMLIHFYFGVKYSLVWIQFYYI